jgi:hypothetical protein
VVQSKAAQPGQQATYGKRWSALLQAQRRQHKVASWPAVGTGAVETNSAPTWPPDTLTVLMLHMQITHVDYMHRLTAVLVLHFTCSYARCQQHTVSSGQLHRMLHFIVAAAATAVAQLFAAGVKVRVAYAAAASAAAAVGFQDLNRCIRQPTAYPPAHEGGPVELLDCLSYQHLRTHQSICANDRVC